MGKVEISKATQKILEEVYRPMKLELPQQTATAILQVLKESKPEYITDEELRIWQNIANIGVHLQISHEEHQATFILTAGNWHSYNGPQIGYRCVIYRSKSLLELSSTEGVPDADTWRIPARDNIISVTQPLITIVLPNNIHRFVLLSQKSAEKIQTHLFDILRERYGVSDTEQILPFNSGVWRYPGK